ncbi:MAG: PilN domain-containing protein [Armatimonadota bacterium]
MLKINLLPKYIYERRNVRKMILLFGVIFIAVAAGMVAWIFQLSSKERLLTDQVSKMEIEAEAVKALEAEVTAEQAKIPPIEAKYQYVKDVLNYNEKLPALYEQVARYTYNRIEYRSMNASGGQLQISAHARSVGDCGRYLLNMYRAGHLFSSVSISSVPGWPAGRSGGGGGGMMGGMMGGMPGGMPGGMMGGMPPMPGMMGGMPGGMPGMTGGSAASTASAADGFDFTVTCALVQPITAPAYIPGGAGAGAQGGAGMTGGMPGGMPGMMPGMTPGMMPGSGAPAPGSLPGSTGGTTKAKG